MYEIKDNDADIDINKLDFIGNDREKCNVNTFNILSNFLSDIFNGIVSLKEAEFKQKKS